MRSLPSLLSVIQLLCLLVGLSLLQPWTAQACQCAQEPTLLGAFQRSDFIVQATIVKQLTSSSPFLLQFSAKLIRAWKACSYLKGITTFTVTTTSEDSACGVVYLTPGVTYLLSGYFATTGQNKTAVSVNSCSYQALWNETDPTRVDGLARSYTNCTCTGARACPTISGVPYYLCPDGVTVSGPQCNYNQTLDTCVREIVQCPSCRRQSDCRTNQSFCSEGLCRTSGTCGTNFDCWNPANIYTAANCTGIANCANRKCEVDCTNHCPQGGDPVNCFADPCSVTSCKEPHVSCESNYCGGCRALFYNASGSRVCKPVNATIVTPCKDANCGSKPNVAPKQCPNGTVANATFTCLFNVKPQACRWKITQTC